jgi:glycine betaine/proline transport system ATP-binding protein
LFKVFGRRPAAAVQRLRDGASAAEIRGTGATAAVIDVSFAVEPGEIFVVMGLSGSGKSTLLRMLNGLLTPTAGTVEIGGTSLAGLDARSLRRLRQQRISMVFQHFALLPHRSVLDNAAYALEVRGVDRRTRRARAREALALVGLEPWAEARPEELSGGMKQRVGLARALASEADVLLMDEAFSALDPLIRREMQDQLLDLQARLGKTIVFITHDLNEAMRLGDRVAILRDGRLVQVGTPESILAAPADGYVASFLADVDRTRVFTAEQVMVDPPAVVPASMSPRSVLQAIAISGGRTALVVDDDEFAGVVTETAVRAAVQHGQPSLDGLVQPPAARVTADTPLAELLGSAAQDELPVVVVSDDAFPVGVVPATAVLTALSGTPSVPPDPTPRVPGGPPVRPGLDPLESVEVQRELQTARRVAAGAGGFLG